MKKIFVKLSMLLFLLVMSTNVAWAAGAFNSLVEQLQQEVYFAELTATPSVTGSGKVYVTDKDANNVPVQNLPTDFDWSAQPENSTVSRGVGAVVEGMDMVQVPFIVYCKANDGWYFKGWSYTQDGADLESLDKQSHFDGQIGILVDPSNVEGSENAKPYTIYATFEKIYVFDYAISGTNTIAKNGSTTLTVTFNLVGEDLDANDFNAPSIVSTTGGGTWSSIDDDPLTLSDVNINASLKQASVEVKYAAPNADDVESKAVLRFSAKSGSQMEVTLSARTSSSSNVEAFLYNGQTKIGEGGTVTALLATDVSAYKNPIIRLNKNYEGTITTAKKISFDLNGYTLGGLTINNGADASLAYSSFGGSVTGAVNVTGGKLTLNGGTITNNVAVSAGAELVQNGAVIVGNVSNAGTFITKDGSITGAVTSNGSLLVDGGTFTNNSGISIEVSNGSAQIKRGNISGSTYGVKTTGGSTTIEKLAVIRGTTKALNGAGGTLTINNGKFADPANMADGTVSLKSAYFVTNTGSASSILEKTIWRNTSGAEFQEGYIYFAASEADAKVSGLSVCRIGKSFFPSLEDALAFANNTNDNVTIVMENDYTLPAGYYTLPSNATLLVPMKDNQDAGFEIVPRNAAGENVILTDENKPSKYRKLTLANGVNLDVHGTIEVSGSQLSSNEVYTGAPFGPYGQIHLNQGSKIVLQDGSILRAWGFITGSGEIDARRGSLVRELFQLGDWKDFYFSGQGLIRNMGSNLGEEIFPITQYYIQNVEAPVKYHPGSNLVSSTCVYAFFPANMLGNGAPPMAMNVVMTANNIPIVGVTGDDAMFLMDTNADAENTWVRKWYDASKDQQVYEINSGAHIGKLVIPLVYGFGMEQALLDMNSGAYNLPITNNFKLHLLSGEMAFTQATALLPGSEVEVDKEAIVHVYNQGSSGVREGQLYVYDADEWGEYAMGAKSREVTYSPSFDGAPGIRDLVNLEDASINVHGTFDTQGGYVYTTETGANIYSSVEDAGTFLFSMEPEEGQKTATIQQVKNVNRSEGSADRATANCNLAFLRNSDAWVANGGNRYQQTAEAAEGTSFCYMDIDGRGGRWMSLEQRGCFTYDATPGNETYYIKPQEYVAVVATLDEDDNIVGNTDHTFSDAAGTGRLFILLTDSTGSNCQWWEVEQKDNYYHCIHPLNDTYYYWDATNTIEDEKGDPIPAPCWKEVKFTITWLNWDGTPILDAESNPIEYTVPYGTQAEWLSTNPTRAKNLDYTYDFTGWSPELGKVTSDVTYTATYEAKQIKYTITFIQDGGVEIERHLLARDEVPVCENEPTRTGYILQWEPALGPVTGNETYTATWLPAPPETYKVVWKNYDGDTLLITNPANGASAETVLATYTEADPTKEATSEYSYKFAGWKPAIAPATTNATYVAQFNEVEQTYEVKFYDEAGLNVLKTENLTYGATPTPPTNITKSEPAEGTTYTYVWKTLDGSENIESVTAAANYKPVFTGTLNKYTVTLQCNVPGACSFTGAGIYDYGQSVSVVATPTSGYEFVKWSERSGDADLGSLLVNGDITLTAIVKVEDTPLPGNLELGLNGTEESPAASYTDITITSDGVSQSSQILNAGNITTLYGNADFVLSKDFAGSTWYCVAVPWRVNVNGGILLNGTTPAVLGQNIDICYYDGSVRAAQGKVDACWVYMRNLGASQQVLQPGRAYMIALRNDASSIIFRKKIQEPLLTTTTSVSQYASATATDANWNAIANPSLFHAYINAGANDAEYGVNRGQVYDAANERYVEYDMSSDKLVVGQPIYVQAAAAKSIVANSSTYAGAPARHASAQIRPTTFELTINANGASTADKLTVRLNENKEENKYIIGQDLVKFGVSTKVAQMWINRYDAKLCVNTIAPEGDVTTFPMSIYAPKAGEYSIAIEREENTNDYALYLTYNGEAIWNLSDGAYTLNLNKGTISNYGLRVSARAPQVTTGVDEAIVEAQGETAMKVLINNQVFIIRGNRVYSVDGQLVK